VGGAARPSRLGRYELITQIGHGGMAEVQLALQRGPAGFEKLVVVKLVHDSLATQKAFVDMLLDEARVAALVKHPNVVDIYDLGQADGRYFIAMEYLEGEPLLAVLRAGRDGKRLDPLSTARLISDTAEGLHSAHELRSMAGEPLELVHHDISLGNIVVLYNGQVKLVDFGVAKATTVVSAKGKVQGKFSYMAPEKLKGAQGDRRSDIFSLGCVMWEALTLRRLFRGGNDSETMKQVLEAPILAPSKVNGDVPPELDPIVMRALERDPARRHATAKDLAVEIEEVLRKRGYGGKNDRIGKYMLDTFKTHIEARKKLVQEVAAKGSASAEVVDAAFAPELATGSPVPIGSTGGDFSMKVARPPLPPRASTEPAVSDFDRPTEISAPPIMDEPAMRRAPLPPPLPPAGTRPPPRPRDDLATEIDGHPIVEPMVAAGSTSTTMEAPIVEAPTADVPLLGRVDKKRLYMLAAAAGLLVILLIALLARGGSKQSQSEVAPPEVIADAAVKEAVVEPAAAPDASPEPAEVQEAAPEPTPEVTPDAAVEATPPPVHHTTTPPTRPSPPPVEKINVPDTVNKALQSFVRGDTRGALGLLQKARAAKPGYAPTYRVLGTVYKKLGDNGNAKRAYQRYLQLSPNAADASKIKDEMSKL
jgi:serine/threonine-protein kinase